MAEALGVAGGIVGIVSLGIQITQGLLQYYTSWKNQDREILSIYASLKNLSKSLEALLTTIQPPATLSASIQALVEEHITRLKDAIKELQEELNMVKGTEPAKTGAHNL